jgi:type 1 glutamine amidotransferase
MSMRSRIVVAAVVLGSLVQPLSAQRGNSVPSVSVRPPDFIYKVTAGAALPSLGWKIGVPIGALKAGSFPEAAGMIDGLQLGYFEATPAELPYTMDDAALAVAARRIQELRLGLSAYHVAQLPERPEGMRRLFEFARRLNIETIIASPEPAALADLDALAAEFNVKVALRNGTRRQTPAYWSPQGMLSAIAGRSARVGLAVDVAAWQREKVEPVAALRQVHRHVTAVSLPDSAALAAAEPILLELSRLQGCEDCRGRRFPTTPVFVSLGLADPQSVGLLSRALLPAIGYRINEISRATPTVPVETIPAAEREAIEKGLPRLAVVKPKQPRKLLVLDLCPQNGYFHQTTAHANLALDLMGRNTGAFEPVFDNNLDNLKYPAIRQYDAIFLNSTTGDVFSDPEVLSGLTRFIDEGGGLAGIHGASYTSMILPAFSELLGAADGPHRVEEATVKIDDPDSPLTRSFGGKSFTRVDEFYHFLPTGPYSREKLRVLLALDTERSETSNEQIRPDRDYGLSWIKRVGKGRVFYTALGHTPTFFATPALAEHVLAGIQFALGDLEADATPSAKRRQ